jgi:hypothetical protein
MSGKSFVKNPNAQENMAAPSAKRSKVEKSLAPAKGAPETPAEGAPETPAEGAPETPAEWVTAMARELLALRGDLHVNIVVPSFDKFVLDVDLAPNKRVLTPAYAALRDYFKKEGVQLPPMSGKEFTRHYGGLFRAAEDEDYEGQFWFSDEVVVKLADWVAARMDGQNLPEPAAQAFENNAVFSFFLWTTTELNVEYANVTRALIGAMFESASANIEAAAKLVAQLMLLECTCLVSAKTFSTRQLKAGHRSDDDRAFGMDVCTAFLSFVTGQSLFKLIPRNEKLSKLVCHFYAYWVHERNGRHMPILADGGLYHPRFTPEMMRGAVQGLAFWV